jgi:peptidoglycan/xylan/chitin deacetylase (PgdA/CDA1 family)
MKRMARIGIWLDPLVAEQRWKYGMNVFELYIEEILGHGGIPFVRLHTRTELEEYKPDILLVALCGEDDATLDMLTEYVDKGGILISYAGLNRMASRLNCREIRGPEVGYVELPKLYSSLTKQHLRSLKHKPWISLQQSEMNDESGLIYKDTPQGAEIAAALLEFSRGEGKLIRWNVNIPYTIVGLQQGTIPVVEDGIPAADGTGTLDEGILKADDRCELDWGLDRLITETGTSYFAYPYADLWREVLISQVLHEAVDIGLSVPILDYWPENIQQVALISHDSDLNLDESAVATLDVLKECDVRSTWCMIEPGYSPHLYNQITADGHELAFHFNALEKENGVWDQVEFERQLEYIRTTTGAPIISNKNHYTRYEGWGELYEWCESNGILGDQTRGPSKKGNIGFLFGTCHPYHPIAWADKRNRMYSVLEVGFLTQDLNHSTLADSSVIVPFLEQVRSVRGVAHFLFHQVHILQQPKVNAALREVVREAKARGFVFWTTEEIILWEQKRRQMKWKMISDGAAVPENVPHGAVIWVPIVDDETPSNGAVETRFGLRCVRMEIDQFSEEAYSGRARA